MANLSLVGAASLSGTDFWVRVKCLFSHIKNIDACGEAMNNLVSL